MFIHTNWSAEAVALCLVGPLDEGVIRMWAPPQLPAWVVPLFSGNAFDLGPYLPLSASYESSPISSSSCTWEYKAKHRQEFPSARCFRSSVWVWEQHNRAHPWQQQKFFPKTAGSDYHLPLPWILMKQMLSVKSYEHNRWRFMFNMPGSLGWRCIHLFCHFQEPLHLL